MEKQCKDHQISIKKKWKSIRTPEVFCNMFYLMLSIFNFFFYSVRVDSFKNTAINLKRYVFQNCKAYFKPEENDKIRYSHVQRESLAMNRTSRNSIDQTGATEMSEISSDAGVPVSRSRNFTRNHSIIYNIQEEKFE